MSLGFFDQVVIRGNQIVASRGLGSRSVESVERTVETARIEVEQHGGKAFVPDLIRNVTRRLPTAGLHRRSGGVFCIPRRG